MDSDNLKGTRVEFPDEDESNDPILTRDYERVALPLFPAIILKLKLAKNLRQANTVLAGITLICFTLTIILVSEEITKDKGDLERYPAQDISRGV